MSYKSMWGAAGIAFASVVSFSVVAQAADLGKHGKYREEPAYTAPTSWAGGYVGGHLGAAWASGSADLTADYYHSVINNEIDDKWDYDPETDYINTGTGHTSQTDTSFIGGLHGGYNWQAAAFVYGLEGDISVGSGSVDYLASFRGRFGVASNKWLFYGTAGLALAGTSFDLSVTDGSINEPHRYSLSDSQFGFVVGGGAEFKISPKWSIGVEGLYYGFDGNSASQGPDYWTYTDVGVSYEANSRAEAAADIGVVRARVNYHLNGGYQPLR